MSNRERIQNDIEDYLSGNSYFDAPYGILTGLHTMKNGGKVRTITFGVCRYLDGCIYIYSPSNIQVKCQGGLSYKFEGRYSSKDELINKFNSETN